MIVLNKLLVVFSCTALVTGSLRNIQSPYLSVEAKMDVVKSDYRHYKIEMKICEPKQKSATGNWFIPDTSHINFDSLKTADVNCGEFLESGKDSNEPVRDEYERLDKFSYSNQVFAWEKILVFKVSDYSSRAWHREMYIVMPIRYKSFITSVSLTDIFYREGTVIFLNDASAVRNGNRLVYSCSVKNKPYTSIKDPHPGWMF